MKPTLRQLEYLVAIADSGRFSDAAKAMNVSQPSLSAQVADAEAHLGVPVFERGRAGAMLTPMGDQIVRRARYILRQVADMKAMAEHGADALYGRIRMGVIPTIGPYLLPSVTRQLHARFPDLRLGIRDEATDRLAEQLDDGRLDTVISTREDHPGMQGSVLFEERLWVAVAPDDELAQSNAPVTLNELKGLPFLTLGLGHRLTWQVRQLAVRADAYISADYEGTSLDAIRNMAALGAGVAILPELYIKTEARRDRSVALRPIGDPTARREISLIWRETSPLAENLPALAQMLGAAAGAILAKA
jgi:LysR family hydrogen peroxide-inducible transcriptional activator